eukprot:1474728-Amphidinium_carterae.1
MVKEAWRCERLRTVWGRDSEIVLGLAEFSGGTKEQIVHSAPQHDSITGAEADEVRYETLEKMREVAKE